MNRIYRFALLILLLTVITACPTRKTVDGMKKLREKNYDFSDFRDLYYKGLKLRIPNFLSRYYNTDYLYQLDGIAYHNMDASLYLSVERFTASEAKDLVFVYEDGEEELDAVNQYYTDVRCYSLEKTRRSITKTFKNKQGIHGFYQFVEGKNYDYDSNKMMYMIATVEKNTKKGLLYFVVQLAVDGELAPYLEDDFKRLIYTMK